MVAEFGGSWDRWESELDLRRLAALRDHQGEYPPVQAMVQSYLGVKGRVPPAALIDQSDEEIEAEFANLMKGG